MNQFHRMPSRAVSWRGRSLAAAGFFAAALLTLAANSAHAQYTGPSDRKGPATARTVAEITADPVDDRPVMLRGKITRKAGKETYVFTDATGSIRVEIDEDDFPATPVDENTVVEIAGEIDTRLIRAPEVEAQRVTVYAEP